MAKVVDRILIIEPEDVVECGGRVVECGGRVLAVEELTTAGWMQLEQPLVTISINGRRYECEYSKYGHTSDYRYFDSETGLPADFDSIGGL